MERVAIIGSPGTGKSTFARQLADLTGLPLIHLDYHYHNSAENYQTDKTAWRAKAEELAQPAKWIIDGNFSSSLKDRLASADTIFYFDMPTHLALRGIVKRWANAKHSKRLDMPDDWQEKPTFGFFKYVLWFRHNYAEDTQQLLSENKDKDVIVFKNHQQVADYVNQ